MPSPSLSLTKTLGWPKTVVFCLVACLSSCVYRFSNSSLKAPQGVRSIAVEAVYDSSRELIPHELLWSAVQRELARSGRIMVTSQSQADAIMLLSLQKTKVSPSGTPSREPQAKDPVADTSTDPRSFRNLRRAGNWTTDESVSLTLYVEVIDLKTRQSLFAKAYSEGATFKSLRPTTVTPSTSAFLNYEEALESKVKTVSEQLAARIVSDFLL